MSAVIADHGPGDEPPSSQFELRHASTDRPFIVTVPTRMLLVIHGAGSRDAADFQMAADLLRAVSDSLGAMLPRALRGGPARPVTEVTRSVPAGLDVEAALRSLADPSCRWRQMIEVSRGVPSSMVQQAIDTARRRGGRETALVRLMELTEGQAIQLLLVGAMEADDAVRTLYRFAAEWHLHPAGELHELVLASPEDVGQDRARSILRVPARAPAPDEG